MGDSTEQVFFSAASNTLLYCGSSNPGWSTISTGGGSTGDRISTTGVASGANLGMVVAQNGTISFTTGGVAGTAFLDSVGRYVGPGVSITSLHGVSSTNGYFSGNVGIRTQNPSYTFEVSGQTRIGYNVAAASPSNTNILSTAHTMLGGNGNNFLSFGQYGAGSSYAQWIQSSFWNPSTAVYNLILQPLGGNVGIGTASPNTKLHVAGGYLTLDNQYAILFKDSGGAFGGYGMYLGSDNKLQIMANSGNRLTIDTNGSVGIGTTSPQALLHVNGVVRSQVPSGFVQINNYFTGGSPYLELSTSHGAWGLSMWASSRRFKNRINDLELDTSKIYKLRPVSFNWNKERGGGRDFGLIAEEVEELFPQMVLHDKDGKPFSVRYEQLAVLMLDQLKVLKNANDDLTRQRASDEATMKRLEERLLMLEATMVLRRGHDAGAAGFAPVH